jgi:Secretion system C-terminal sorting domain
MFRISILLSVLFFLVTVVFTKPSMNGSSGCSGGSCHSFSAGILSVSVISNTQVEVLLTGVSSGQDVAGELVDSNGNIVDVVNSTKTNPFLLKAPSAGRYRINAGFRRPNKQWDSTSVDFGISGLENKSNTVPDRFTIYQNYPNPFNPSTTIKFYIPNSKYVEIVIFDVLGNKIETLLSKNLETGIHTYRLQAHNFSSGVYFYKIIAGNEIITGKMILNR